MFRFILDTKKLLILMIFIMSCSEETIIYDEIENKDSTIQTSTYLKLIASSFKLILNLVQEINYSLEA